MLQESSYETERSDATPVDQIYSKEFAEGLDKAGSLISMLEGKKINPTTLFSLIIENPNYQIFFTEITASENFKQALLSLLYLYPSLVKSKITKSVIRKLNSNGNHRTRKASLQQTPVRIKEIKGKAV